VLKDFASRWRENEEGCNLLGANGSGKTTLLHVSRTHIRRRTGNLSLLWRAGHQAPAPGQGLGRRFRKEVVLLFQYPEGDAVNPTVYDEIAYGLARLGADLDGRVRDCARGWEWTATWNGRHSS